MKSSTYFCRCRLVKERAPEYMQRALGTPEKVAEITRKIINDDNREYFIVFFLDTQNKISSVNIASIGTENACLVSPREIVRTALLSNSSRLILAHNHPSGTAEPSDEDRAITAELKNATDLFGIKILDHVITGDQYFSFQEKGIL